MKPQSTGTIDDDPNLDLLADVVLHSFTGSPTTIGPFDQALLHWSVSAPSKVRILLSGLEVSASGERWVTPVGSVESYFLSAKAGMYTKLLGIVTIHVNFAGCFTAETALLPQLLAASITEKINADTTGIHFRVIPVTVNGYTSYVRSTPQVVIIEDTLSIDLKLEQDEPVIPDPAVDIHVDFGIQVVPNPLMPTGPRRIAAINQHINVDVSAGPITWTLAISFLLPDILQYKINAAEDAARVRAQRMIDDIVGPIEPKLVHGKNLNNFFPPPNGMAMHDARFFIDEGGAQTFAVTFCPDESVEANPVTAGSVESAVSGKRRAVRGEG
jgi:hypothetical protein